MTLGLALLQVPLSPPAPSAVPAATNGLQITGLGGASAPWTIVVLLTFLSLIPSLLLCVTPFARLLIVFHFLRQALGLQTTPSNQTLIGLSMILTFFLMQPVGAVIYDTSVVPLERLRWRADPCGCLWRITCARKMPRCSLISPRNPGRITSRICPSGSCFLPISCRSSKPAFRSARCCSCRSWSWTWWSPLSRRRSA